MKLPRALPKMALAVIASTNMACALHAPKFQYQLSLQRGIVPREMEVKHILLPGGFRSQVLVNERPPMCMNLRGGFHTDVMPISGLILMLPIYFAVHAFISISVMISIPISLYALVYGRKFVEFIQKQSESQDGCLRLLAVSHALIFLTLASTGKLVTLGNWTRYFVFAIIATALPAWWILTADFIAEEDILEILAEKPKRKGSIIWKSALALLFGALGSAASLHTASLNHAPPPPPPTRFVISPPPLRPQPAPARAMDDHVLYGPPLGEVYGAHRGDSAPREL